MLADGRRRGSPSPISRHQRGQTLVEFALTVPIFLLLVLGLIDLARGVMLYNTVATAAREGARFGIVLLHEPTWGASAFSADGNVPQLYDPITTYGGPGFEDTIVGVIARRNAALDLAQTSVEIEREGPSGLAVAGTLTVTVTQPFTPVVTYILGGTAIDVTASSKMLIEPN